MQVEKQIVSIIKLTQLAFYAYFFFFFRFVRSYLSSFFLRIFKISLFITREKILTNVKQVLDNCHAEIEDVFHYWLSWFHFAICLLCVCYYICFLPQLIERKFPDFHFIKISQSTMTP